MNIKGDLYKAGAGRGEEESTGEVNSIEIHYIQICTYMYI
jgi:hypothetical protein